MEGEHPDFGDCRLDHLKLEQSRMGCFYRTGPKSEDCHLIMGTVHQPKIDEGLKFFHEMKDANLSIKSGFKEIDDYLQSQFRKGVVLAIRDFYPWWASQGERFDSGKLLFIEDEHINPNSQRIQSIFFDDNLHLDQYQSEQKKLIVDVRKISTGESYPGLEGLFGKCLVKAEPVEAILDRNYFINVATAAYCRQGEINNF